MNELNTLPRTRSGRILAPVRVALLAVVAVILFVTHGTARADEVDEAIAEFIAGRGQSLGGNSEGAYRVRLRNGRTMVVTYRDLDFADQLPRLQRFSDREFGVKVHGHRLQNNKIYIAMEDMGFAAGQAVVSGNGRNLSALRNRSLEERIAIRNQFLSRGLTLSDGHPLNTMFRDVPGEPVQVRLVDPGHPESIGGRFGRLVADPKDVNSLMRQYNGRWQVDYYNQQLGIPSGVDDVHPSQAYVNTLRSRWSRELTAANAERTAGLADLRNAAAWEGEAPAASRLLVRARPVARVGGNVLLAAVLACDNTGELIEGSGKVCRPYTGPVDDGIMWTLGPVPAALERAANNCVVDAVMDPIESGFNLLRFRVSSRGFKYTGSFRKGNGKACWSFDYGKRSPWRWWGLGE